MHLTHDLIVIGRRQILIGVSGRKIFKDATGPQQINVGVSVKKRYLVYKPILHTEIAAIQPGYVAGGVP